MEERDRERGGWGGGEKMGDREKGRERERESCKEKLPTSTSVVDTSVAN